MKFIIVLLLALPSMSLPAQDDLMNILDSVTTPKTEYSSATFKGTKIISGQSVEAMKEGQLLFNISHRFGRLNSGVSNFWGIDQSLIYLSFEYGVTDWLEVGIGRTVYEKTVTGYSKISLLNQSKGERFMPVSISYFGSVAANTQKWDNPERTNYFSSRLTYVNQFLIARKFSDAFSLQLSPTYLHRNLVPTALDNNDLFAMGIGGRYKLTNRISVNFEYFYVLRPTWNVQTEFTNPISIGFDIETGGHVFQIMLSNSSGMIEKHYIADNTGDWTKGELHLGFNLTRVFTLF